MLTHIQRPGLIDQLIVPPIRRVPFKGFFFTSIYAHCVSVICTWHLVLMRLQRITSMEKTYRSMHRD